MRLEERQKISRELTAIVDRLRPLCNDPPIVSPQWPSLKDSVNTAYKLFKQGLEPFIIATENYNKRLNGDPLSYNMWLKRIKNFWSRVERIREYHNSLFNRDF